MKHEILQTSALHQRVVTRRLVACLLASCSPGVTGSSSVTNPPVDRPGASTPVQVTGADTRRCGNYGSPHPDMPPEFAQFSFIIGDYDVGIEQWDADRETWSEAKFFARWNGYYIFDGRGIADEWFDPGYGFRPESGAGINIRLYDVKAKLWKTAWHYTTNHEVRELHQRVQEDGRLWLWQVFPEVPERRLYFETYPDGRWARITMDKNASGTWVKSRRLHAKPADCEGVAADRKSAHL